MKTCTHAFLRSVAALSLALAASGALADTITVSAAASLTDAFKEIAKGFEAKNPGDTVQLNFAGSGALFQQIDKGAPVDVFASADQVTMDRAQKNGLVIDGTRQTFVQNTLVLIQPSAATAKVDSLESLKDKTVQRIAVGNTDSVPVGRYTKAALEAAGHWEALQPKVILTQNVRQALDYVARGEVDAGFVYGSDAALMADKVKVSYAVPVKTPVSYPIAVIKNGSNQAGAKRFIAEVTSESGQKILARYGFVPVAGK